MLENKILDIMGFVASLDMGSGKMVMALGEKSGSDCRLVGVISIASQGVNGAKLLINFGQKHVSSVCWIVLRASMRFILML